MLKLRTTKSVYFTFPVHTSKADIEEGECRLASHCMEKLAVTRALKREFPGESNFHVRVDAGYIKFNVQGYRWKGETPRIAKASLIAFDMRKPVDPHSYRVRAERRNK